MKTCVAAALTFAISVGVFGAGEFDGWCMNDDGCVGSIPLAGDKFSTCEENCTMKNPVKVLGLDATLYDVSCAGDSSNTEQRMMFMTYKDFNGATKGLAISPSGPEELVRCE